MSEHWQKSYELAQLWIERGSDSGKAFLQTIRDMQDREKRKKREGK